MNPLKSLGKFFVKFGSLVHRGLHAAVDAGLTDELKALALTLVRRANDEIVDKAERREFVVKFLVARGAPEFVARIAVELAYKLYKKQVEERYGV